MPNKKPKPMKSHLMDFNVSAWCLQKARCIKKVQVQRAVIYCRVSDKKQVKDWFGLEWQEGHCRNRCETQNPPIEVEKVFMEPWISWRQRNRKAFNESLQYLKEMKKKKKQITHYVVSEASRISRNDQLLTSLQMEEPIKKTWAKIITLDMPTLDDSTDEGQLMKYMQYIYANYEAKKIYQRWHNGKVNRLKSGYRPFGKPPLWYIRQRHWRKNYEDLIHEWKWKLIKEGLKLFARDVIVSQADLWRFRCKRGLTMNNWKKLQKTFIEKQLQLHRLFYYAGHIFYPERWVNEPIPWKQAWLISLETAYMIVEKIQVIHSKHKRISTNMNKMTDENPLRGVVICPYCNRKFTSWNTSKYRMKDGVRIKKLYPYYGCANSNCEDRMYIRKEVLEGAFGDMLESIKVDNQILKIIPHLFEEERKRNGKKKAFIINDQKKRVNDLGIKLEQIEQSLIRTSIPKLHEKLEKEWVQLDHERSELEKNIGKQSDDGARAKNLLNKSIKLFQNPSELWKVGSPTMRQLLVKVRFWDHLLYYKNQWLRTTWNAIIYNVFSKLTAQNSSNRQARDKLKTLDASKLKQLRLALEDQSDHINTLRTHIEDARLWKSSHDENSDELLEPP